jgi:hypothetical protein
MKTISDNDAKDPKKLKLCTKKACNQLLAFTYLENVDKTKY